MMTQPTPNHQPPGKTAPRYVNAPKLPLVPLAIIAAFIGLLVWTWVKTAAGVGL
jgi:hypothetical protein